jgi:CPA2 family monovalent cation:H+ antiporter-2
MHLLEEITVIATVSVIVTLLSGPFETSGRCRLSFYPVHLVGPKALSLAHDPEAIEVIAEVRSHFSSFYHRSGIFLIPAEKYFPPGRPRRTLTGGCHHSGHFPHMPEAWISVSPKPLSMGLCLPCPVPPLCSEPWARRGELDAPHGRFIVGTLIFQDLCIVPMVLIVPLLINGLDKPETWQAIMLALAKAALVVVLLFAVSRIGHPPSFSLGECQPE